MKWRTQLLRYFELIQFIAAVYIRKLRNVFNYYNCIHCQSLRIVVKNGHSHRDRHEYNRCIWLDSRCAFLIATSSGKIKKLFIKGHDDNSSKVALFCDKICPILCNEPVVIIDELCAFNLSNKGLHYDDAYVDICCCPGVSEETEQNQIFYSSKTHIALIITSFYDEWADYSDELQQYFHTPRLVSVGDIIAVPWHEAWNDKVKDIFFKIIKFEDAEGLSEAVIDSERTILYQVEKIYERIPYNDVTCFVPEKFSQLAKRISKLIAANLTMKSMSPLVIVLSGSLGSGKKLFLKHLSSVTHLDVYFSNCLTMWSDIPLTFETNIRNAFEIGRKNHTVMLAFLNADLFDCDFYKTEHETRILTCLAKHLVTCPLPAVFLVCNNDKLLGLSAALRSLVLYHFEIPTLTIEDRKSVIMHGLDEPNLIDVAAVSSHTSGFSLSELHTLLTDAQFRKHSTNSVQLRTDHFFWAIDSRNKALAYKIGAPVVPRVTWDDVGGLEEVKQIIIESLFLNLRGKEVLSRSGVLLYGPPGCGKTLIAKAVANQFQITFLSVKGPELLNKYVGQSEANVRKVFEKARMAAPCVVFFDELDSLASVRGRCGDSSRVADNTVSQLIAELDSLEGAKIFVLGATNRPDLLDSSLLRPGRFDRIVEVGEMKDTVTRERVLRASSRYVTFANDVDLREIAELCSHLSSGADLHAVISRAQMNAIRKRIHAIEAGLASSEEKVLVTQNNLKNAVKEVKPSVGVNCEQLYGF